MDRIKKVLLFNLKDVKIAFIIYYAIMIALYVVVFVGAYLVMPYLREMSGAYSDELGVGNISFGSTPIFTFVIALCTFKEPFRLFIQNGVSRKTQFLGKAATALVISTGIAAADELLYIITRWIAGNSFTIDSGYVEVIRTSVNMDNLGAWYNVGEFFYVLATCLALYSLGCFITSLFYRLPTYGKALVGAGVPVFILMVFPLLDFLMFRGAITKWLYEMLMLISGPVKSIFTLLVVSVVFMGLHYLLMRKAVLRTEG